jgi:hypothetical protein
MRPISIPKGRVMAAANPHTGANALQSVRDLVLNENPDQVQLTASQVAVWYAWIPILCKHGPLAVRTSGLAAAEERSLTKKHAAEFLGISVRKLQTHMSRKQIKHQKLSAGRSGAGRLLLSELQRFQESRSAGRIDKDCK